jgi:hypothetical protein
MKFIKKYQMFTEEVVIDTPTEPVKTISTTEEEDILEATSTDVINRFARLYKDLPKEEKQQINNYFK